MRGEPSSEEVAALQLVDKQFHECSGNDVVNGPQVLQESRSRPLSRTTLGAGTAVMVRARLSRLRVKLEHGVSWLSAHPRGDDRVREPEPAGVARRRTQRDGV